SRMRPITVTRSAAHHPAARPAASRLASGSTPPMKECCMKPLLRNLMGNGSKDQEMLEAMRVVLANIQRERERYEALVESSHAGAERLQKLDAPIAKAETEMDALQGRIAQMEERLQAMVKLADLFQNLDERASGLTKSTQWAESRLSAALEGSQKIES